MEKKYLKSRYGKINIKELKACKIQNNPKVSLSEYVGRLYNPSVDKKSASIHIKLKDRETIKLSKGVKCELAAVEWCRAGSSPHKIKLPKFLDPQLAYLTGYLQGDGGFKDIKRSYEKTNRFEHKIIVGDEFEIQIEKIKVLFKNLFNLNTTIRKERIKKGERLYYLNPTCKIVYRFFTKVFGFREGPKGNIKIPKIIEAAPSSLIKWYLRGFIDADGDVRATEYYGEKLPTPRFKVRLADKGFILQLKKHLNSEFNVHLTGPYTDTQRDWYIQCGKKGLINAQKERIFFHPVKRWRIDKFCGFVAQPETVKAVGYGEH